MKSQRAEAHRSGRPTVLDISLDALEANFLALKAHTSGARFMAVLKANAYGHGLVPCAKFLESRGVDAFGVALVEEAIELRTSGICCPILVFGGVFAGQIPLYLENDLEITVSSIWKLNLVEQIAAELKRPAKVQLKIDTGMERIGVHYFSAEAFLRRAMECRHVKITGIYTHLACSGDVENKISRLQLERFRDAIHVLEKESFPFPPLHVANSAGLIALPESHFSCVRPGLALYGAYPAPHLRSMIELKPVGALRSQVVYFKVVRAGSGVSYEHTWVSQRDTRVVTIPLGYGDGYSTRLSNVGQVLIRGRRYPVIGRVCMDQFMVDIGDNEAYNGDEVVMLGEQAGERISAEELGIWAGTSAYEILTTIHPRVPRRYFYQGSLLSTEDICSLPKMRT